MRCMHGREEKMIGEIELEWSDGFVGSQTEELETKVLNLCILTSIKRDYEPSQARKFLPDCYTRTSLISDNCDRWKTDKYEPKIRERFVRGHAIVFDDKAIKKIAQQSVGDEAYDKNFNVVPIVGIGGVDKTTLARLLYYDTKMKDHFKVMAWVCVFGEFDILKIICHQGKQRFHRYKFAPRGYNEEQFILVMDDVWNENNENWDTLVRPWEPRSKIIITTWKEQLVRNLSFEEALTLFSQHTLGVSNLDAYPILRPHGGRHCEKVQWLALALKALGRSLRTITNEEN
ncbi:hypothetical protein OSB04_011039 [Centaurea solstitialis]|uniref:NB-ARC domain-containing protein n=1 Tax=Centaurea solstitialis TaxID=347529 RepID=A0AA38T8P0_9ASTR|nr:hypothetical protein OSB04_011039 [Centaurea solstitialis]